MAINSGAIEILASHIHSLCCFDDDLSTCVIGKEWASLWVQPPRLQGPYGASWLPQLRRLNLHSWLWNEDETREVTTSFCALLESNLSGLEDLGVHQWFELNDDSVAALSRLSSLTRLEVDPPSLRLTRAYPLHGLRAFEARSERHAPNVQQLVWLLGGMTNLRRLDTGNALDITLPDSGEQRPVCDALRVVVQAICRCGAVGSGDHWRLMCQTGKLHPYLAIVMRILEPMHGTLTYLELIRLEVGCKGLEAVLGGFGRDALPKLDTLCLYNCTGVQWSVLSDAWKQSELQSVFCV